MAAAEKNQFTRFSVTGALLCFWAARLFAGGRPIGVVTEAFTGPFPFELDRLSNGHWGAMTSTPHQNQRNSKTAGQNVR
eukprot:189101-Pleurochrysis_carterae.AAC.1